MSYAGHTVQEWDELLADGTVQRNHREALVALGYGPEDVAIPDEALPTLLALVESGKPATRCRCLGVLRKLENPSDEVLDRVIAVVSDPDAGGNAYRAGYLLGRFPDRADYTVPKLVNLLENGAPGARPAAVALGRLGPAAKEALLALGAVRAEADDDLVEAIDNAVGLISGGGEQDTP